jgi:acyl carrier protein
MESSDLEALRVRLAGMIERSIGTPSARLLADTPFLDLGYDSLDIVEIGILAENEFGLDLEGQVTGRNLPRHLSDVASVLQANLSKVSS